MRIHADPDPQPWLNISPYPYQAEGEWTLNNVCVLDNVYVCGGGCVTSWLSFANITGFAVFDCRGVEGV